MNSSTVNMFVYNGWANEKVFQHLSKLPSEIFTTEIKSVFPTIQDALVHVYVVDCGWLDTLKGIETNDLEEMGKKVQQLAEYVKTKDMVELREMFVELHEETLSFLKTIELMDDQISVFFGHARFSYADTVSHIVNHGTYHRGNITAMLRQMDHSGCQTDFGLFLFEKK